jgi:hypothetical protein
MIIWTPRLVLRLVGAGIMFLGLVMFLPVTQQEKAPGAETLQFLQRLPTVQQFALISGAIGLLVLLASFLVPKARMGDD